MQKTASLTLAPFSAGLLSLFFDSAQVVLLMRSCKAWIALVLFARHGHLNVISDLASLSLVQELCAEVQQHKSGTCPGNENAASGPPKRRVFRGALPPQVTKRQRAACRRQRSPMCPLRTLLAAPP